MELYKPRDFARGLVPLVSLPSMWCSSCQQDVPTVLSHEDQSGRHCARCRSPLFVEAATATPVAAKPIPAIDEDWELDSDLRNIERLVTGLKQSAGRATWVPDEPPISIPVAAASVAPAVPAQSTAQPDRPRGGTLVWAALSLGLMTFVCGGVLLAWSYATDRPDLRTLGMPLALAGQAALIVGLVLQLEGLWSSSRQTRETLTELDGQIHELRHATTLITTTHSAPGQSFYAHMADGASPQLLLADLKGQMDLLATRMANQRRAA